MQRISPDYVRKLFRQEGTSFSDYVLLRRLKRVHAALIGAPVSPDQRIASIAFQTRFSDLLLQSRLPPALRQIALRRPRGWRMSLDGAAGFGSIARMTSSASGDRGTKLSATP